MPDPEASYWFRIVVAAFLGNIAADVGWALGSGHSAPSVANLLGSIYVGACMIRAELEAIREQKREE